MTEQAQSQNKPETRLARFKGYLRSDEITLRFTEMLGKREAQAYIMDVYLAVANSEKLQECTYQSIVSSALRSAALHLSVDPATAHAYLVPFKNECSMLPGYKGYIFMALRTGKYRYINVGEVFEGEIITKDRISGFITVAGEKKSEKVIGYIGAFEMLSGYKHDVYWTIEQIYEHAKKYSKAYQNNKKDSPWFTAPVVMEKKTVVRDLIIHWGYLDPHDLYIIKNDDEFSNGHDLPDENHVTMKVEPVKSQEQIMLELGFEPDKSTTEEQKTEEPKTEEPKSTEAEAKAEPKADPATGEIKTPAASTLPPLRLLPEQLKDQLVKKAKTFEGQKANGKRGVVIGTLEAILSEHGDPTANRRMLLKYLTGKASSKDIPDDMILALYAWLNPKPDEGGEFHPDPMSAREAIAAFNAAQPVQDGLF